MGWENKVIINTFVFFASLTVLTYASQLFSPDIAFGVSMLFQQLVRLSGYMILVWLSWGVFQDDLRTAYNKTQLSTLL